MPQGPGTYGSQRGRPPLKKESGFKMKGHSLPGPNQKSPLRQDYTEALDHHKKYVAKKTAKKTGTKVAKQIFKRFLGPVGVAYTAYDAYNIAKHSIKEKSLKKGLKKWWNE